MTVLQTFFVLVVSLCGENYVSVKGYYRYTELNCCFIGMVPLWIPFMWITVIQGSLFLSSLVYPIGLMTLLVTAVISTLLDLLIIEPYFCRRRRLWSWSPVEEGYFDFIPEKFNQFTAPPGNYITWFIFPFVSNALLLLLDHQQVLFT